MFKKVPRYEGEILVKASAQEAKEAIKGFYQGMTGFAGMPVIDTADHLKMQDPVNNKNVQEYFLQNASLNHDLTEIRIVVLCPDGGNAQSYFNGIVERMKKLYEVTIR